MRVEAKRPVWRVIRPPAGCLLPPEVSPRQEAAWNMAVDEALLESVIGNGAPPAIRLYTWSRPGLTVGRFQDIVRTLDLEECLARGILPVRRITGGRGILHGDDLTLSIAASLES